MIALPTDLFEGLGEVIVIRKVIRDNSAFVQRKISSIGASASAPDEGQLHQRRNNLLRGGFYIIIRCRRPDGQQKVFGHFL